MPWDACFVVFFAFLQLGEMTTPSVNSFDLSWPVTPMDIALNNKQDASVVQLTLKGSKTNQTRQGINPFIGWTYNELCPVAPLFSNLAIEA